jgi:[acyl-carrier-protein] S-malonyltransferase
VAKLALLFPGQGSQKVGMGRALRDGHAAARAVFEEADTALGFSISKLCFDGPEAELTLTANQQPAILATSVAALRVLEAETGLRPTAVAGHSLGEYSALVAAGALALADAVRLVHLRGRFMQEAVPSGVGAMAAVVGLDAEAVAAACAEAAQGEVVSPANLNGGGQIVIAGHKGAVERACAGAKARGAKLAKLLAVSAPFHCGLMQPAADRLARELAKVTFETPKVPVVTNVEAAPNTNAARIPELLTRQVTGSVRWEESVRAIAALGVTRAIEVGAGGVLAGLVKRITSTIEVHGAADPDAIAALGQSPVAREAAHG